MLDFDAVAEYLDREINRIPRMTDWNAYDKLKEELNADDAQFQFGKQCGYFLALQAIKYHIRSMRQSGSSEE